MSTIDDLKVRTSIELVPISNLISRKPVPKVDNIARINKLRVFDISADIKSGENANVQLKKIEEWLVQRKSFTKRC